MTERESGDRVRVRKRNDDEKISFSWKIYKHMYLYIVHVLVHARELLETPCSRHTCQCRIVCGQIWWTSTNETWNIGSMAFGERNERPNCCRKRKHVINLVLYICGEASHIKWWYNLWVISWLQALAIPKYTKQNQNSASKNYLERIVLVVPMSDPHFKVSYLTSQNGCWLNFTN